jgi:hypothetical protein
MNKVIWWAVLAFGLLGILYFSWLVVQASWLSATPHASIIVERRNALVALLGVVVSSVMTLLAALKVKGK